MLVELGLIALAVWVLWKALQPNAETKKFGNEIPGPESYPVVGNLFNIPLTGAAAMKAQAQWPEKYGNVVRLWMGNLLVVQLFSPEDIEHFIAANGSLIYRYQDNNMMRLLRNYGNYKVILKHLNLLKKAKLYDFAQPWLGTGLLTSSGSKWRMRRKAITPTFHFKILDSFVDVFNRNGNIFVDRLQSKVDQGCFDVLPYLSAYTLDVISETAMGTQIKAQSGHNIEYQEAVRKMSNLLGWRMNCPLVHMELAYALFGGKRKQNHFLKTLKGQTDKVIGLKEKELQNQKNDAAENPSDDLGIKKKMAFLEMLLRMRNDGNPAFQTEEDVREEVDTFMFEGHDTTTAGICFALYSLAAYPQYQEKVYQEVKSKYEERDCNPTMEEINEFKYLDMFLKEVLRLFPSVPNIGRTLTEPVKLPSGYTLPVGCLAVINIYQVHRNRSHFPNPEVFNPENFSPEASQGRHPFAYVPFSAGPRNCIGQKFAMLEMKMTIVKLIVNFKIERDPKDEVVLDGHLVLQGKGAQMIKLTKRK